jgi:hypothetical protein
MGHNKDFWEGFDFACAMLDELGYTKMSTHNYNIADCLKAKFNRLPKKKVRKNDNIQNINIQIAIEVKPEIINKPVNTQKNVMKSCETCRYDKDNGWIPICVNCKDCNQWDPIK